MKRFSFRQKLLLTYAACALVLIFATVVSVSYYINLLQRSNVQDALDLAQEQAEKMADAVHDIMATNRSSNIEDPAVKDSLRAVTRINLTLNKNIMWAAIISPNGERMIKEFGNSPSEPTIQHDETQTDVSDLSLPDGNKLQVSVTAAASDDTADINVPIPIEGSNPAQLRVKVKQSQFFHRIEDSSQRITRALIFGCMLMLVFLLGVFYILWRMFFRQLELQENNAKLDQMAYVGSLASGLAHEIRNPLSSMNVNLEVIKEELNEIQSEVGERAALLSTRVQREVMQLNSTLTSFLDFALPRKEGYSQFPLRGLVEELMDAHGEELKSREITVELVSPPASATVIEADRHLLHQAVRNILLNAIQIVSGSVKKSIKIKLTTLPKDYIQLSISDSGPGIDEENISKIFEVFFSTRKGGSGFGLAIARKIVQEHSGRIWAENNLDSRGASFVLELPAFAPEEQSEETQSSSRISRFWSSNMKTKDERN